MYMTTLTFAVAGVVPQHRTFFDRSERLEQQLHIILVLLLVQHPDKQLPIFCNPHHPRTAYTCHSLSAANINNMNDRYKVSLTTTNFKFQLSLYLRAGNVYIYNFPQSYKHVLRRVEIHINFPSWLPPTNAAGMRSVASVCLSVNLSVLFGIELLKALA